MQPDMVPLSGHPSRRCCPGRESLLSGHVEIPLPGVQVLAQPVVFFDRSAAFGPSTAADKKRGAAQREAARFAAEAAYRQRTAETLDWLGSARIALQVRTQGLGLGESFALSATAIKAACGSSWCVHRPPVYWTCLAPVSWTPASCQTLRMC